MWLPVSVPRPPDDAGEHELRCERHLHAKLVPGVLEVRCHQCSKRLKARVTHRWQVNLQALPDRVEQGQGEQAA